MKTKRHKNIAIFMREVVSPGHVDHVYSPFLNILARLNPLWRYTCDIADLVSFLTTLPDSTGCVEKLRIHSHGNKNPPGLSIPFVGPLIRMGDDNLSLEDFDSAGDSTGSVKNLLEALRRIMRENGIIIFDACNQGDGELLKNISKFLGPNITVNGFSKRVGNPLTRGDISYRNGMRV
jgi:hypothetical protein